MNLITQATTPMIAMLENLKAWLTHAKKHSETQGFDANNWLQTRLIVDMLPLAKQVQIACDFAKNTHAKLLNTELPAFGDDEATLDEFIARIDNTLAVLAGLKDQTPPTNWETQTVEINLKNGTHLKFSGLDYLNHFALPAFYFHIMTAYNLLRSNGVKIGKLDYHGAIIQRILQA